MSAPPAILPAPLIHRTALIARIRSDVRPVTLLVAPAGFGKTVLAEQLAAAVSAHPVPGRPGAFDGGGWHIRDIAPGVPGSLGLPGAPDDAVNPAAAGAPDTPAAAGPPGPPAAAGVPVALGAPATAAAGVPVDTAAASARATSGGPVPPADDANAPPVTTSAAALDPLDLDMPGRLVILCRPGQEPPGLARLRLYGRLFDIPADDLLFGPDELPAEAHARSAGWPLMAGGAGQGDAADLAAFLARDVLSALPAESLLAALLDSAGQTGEGGELAALIPPLRLPGDTQFRALLPEALETALGARLLADGPTPLGGTDSILPPRPGLALRMVHRLLQAGAPNEALRLFRQSGGWYLFYAVAPGDFAALIDAMPRDLLDTDTELVLARALLALKAGETGLARRLMADRFGAAELELARAFSPASALPRRAQVFRVALMIYEDITVPDATIETLLDVLARLPLDAHLPRGTVYNALLEIFLRQRRYAEAEDVALRAAQSYERGRAPLLRFYIALHRAVMRLLRGESGAAAPELHDARIWLDRLQFDSPSDWRILRLVEAVVRHEDGDPQPILAFLDEDLDGFAGGETWPTLVELAVLFGSQAFAEQVSTGAALAYVDRWWVRLAMNRQFRVLLDLRKAQVLQNAGRWGEAARTLSPVQARIDRVWVESADAEFARLATRDDIQLALCWLRQIVHDRPGLPYLGRKLDQMAANDRLTGRQRIALDIWRAHVARQSRELSQMRALLRGVFDAVARNGALSVLAEEQVFLTEMWRDAATAAYLTAVGPARSVMRRLEKSRVIPGTEAARAHLTRQELKVLMLLTEGASNKIIARQLGVSEPTVKFHLKNLYAKLGCHRRAEAVQAARALGWIR
ncbi:response regulator transcription factor [Marinibacterium sp. SX1]|uniref:helix-turn-helix transcriptional regulator n=1 Tax=Marinibacterium sp. SX1 TaxID=3388424 RepID=UPI003D1670DE